MTACSSWIDLLGAALAIAIAGAFWYALARHLTR